LPDDPRDPTLFHLPFRRFVDQVGVGLPDCCQQLGHTHRTIIPNRIQEERRCRVHGAVEAALKVLPDAVGVDMLQQITLEPVGVEIKRGRILDEMIVSKHLLALKAGGVHLPEPALRARGFGGFSGLLGAWVHSGEREVTLDEAELISKESLQFLDDGCGSPTVRTLVVAVFDQRHRRRHRTLNMVAPVEHYDGR
jgi:hypothetical protein